MCRSRGLPALPSYPPSGLPGIREMFIYHVHRPVQGWEAQSSQREWALPPCHCRKGKLEVPITGVRDAPGHWPREAREY